jgi:endo-1,4-beta-xylanase
MCRLKLAMMLWCLAVVPGAANDGQPAALAAAPKEKTGRRDGAWADPNKAEPAGTKYRTFHSQTIHAEVSYLIYLPPDYEMAKDRRYPVVYWLHGGGGSQRTGDNFIERLDAAIRSGKAPPMIAILVNGVGSSLFCDSIDGKKPVETVIIRDLIPHVDKTYRTYGTRQMRAIEGFSMGGFWTIHLGFKYPELFGAITALAHAPICPNSGWQRVERVWQAGPFAGNAERFAPEDPFHLVDKNADTIRRDVRTRLIVGDADNPNTVARTKELHAKMTELRLPCELIVVPGVRHSYQNLYAELGDREFAFYRDIFADDSASAPKVGKPGPEEKKPRAPEENRLARRGISWVEPDKTEPAGTTYTTFHSQTVNGEVSYLLYLPPDYEKEQPKRYPVLYWLHGSGATQSKGGEIVRRVDQAIRDGKVSSMIVVLVNGLRGATMYCDTKDGKWPLESVIVNDLIPHIDATYRTTARRQGRAIEGFSMGGFGAAHFGFKYPELFGVVSVLAPALLGPDLTAEMPKRKWLEHLSFVFSGDVDCFQANDPIQLVVKNAERIRGQCIIRLVPHDEEGKWLIPRCEELHALLEKYKIAHEFDPRTDVTAHNYRLLYDKIGDKALGFYAKAFAVAAQAGDWKLERVEVRNGIEIYQCQRPGKPEFRRLLAKPRGEGPFPAVVLNHGGRSGAPFLYRCLAFSENGFVVIACDLRHAEIPVVDFRNLVWEEGMGPGTSREDIRRDRENVDILKSLSFVNSKQIAMYGHSGGGHLTVGFLALGNQDQAVKVAAITSAGIYPKHPDQLPDPKNPERYRAFPQINHVKAMSVAAEEVKNIHVPLLSIHGRKDHICPLESAVTLKEELDKYGKENRLIVRDEADHNDVKTADHEEIIRFIRKHLGLPVVSDQRRGAGEGKR